VLGGYLVYKERLRAPQLLGLGAILLGIILATLPA
jgi:multidrug transporter EmrE-like cation transporter